MQFCPKLREIYISDQKLSSKLGFEFEEQTMKSLGGSLLTLEAERNHLKNIQNLEYLMNLRVLRLGGNLIESIECLDNNDNAWGIRFDFFGGTGELNFDIEELDDKNILPKEREFIMKFYNIDK